MKTLYEWAAGEEAIRRLMDAFYDRVEATSVGHPAGKRRNFAPTPPRHFARPEITRLDELRLAALEDRIDAELRLGRHAALVPELETLVAAHPLRERLLGQQMLALYRSGRQADALEAYRKARTALREELGLEPGPSLRQLEQAILAQDPALGEPSRLPGPPVGRRRLGLLVAAALAAIVTVSVGLAVALRDGSNVAVLPDSVVEIDAANNKVVDSIVVGGEPGPVRVLAGGAFVTSVRTRRSQGSTPTRAT